jgi:hypothetical protein
VKGRDVFVEIDGEEVQAADSRLNRRLVLMEYVVEIICRFGGNGPDLLVAASVARNEENGDTFDLGDVSRELMQPFVGRRAGNKDGLSSYLILVINSLLSI